MQWLALVAMASSPWAGAVEVDTAAMWRELESHCARGLCTLATGSRLSALANTTDCRGRMLAYEYGLTLIPSRNPQLESFDALQLETTCGVTRPPAALETVAVPQLPAMAAGGALFFVSADGDDSSETGDANAPYKTVHRALAAARASSAAAKSIVLKPGTHYLNQTLALTPADSGTTIAAEPGAPVGSVIVSGGVPLSPSWEKSSRKGSGSDTVVWETVIKDASLKAGFKGLTTLAPHRRVTRARYPNASPSEGAELCTDCWTNGVVRWHHNMSCVGKATVVYKDLRGEYLPRLPPVPPAHSLLSAATRLYSPPLPIRRKYYNTFYCCLLCVRRKSFDTTACALLARRLRQQQKAPIRPAMQE